MISKARVTTVAFTGFAVVALFVALFPTVNAQASNYGTQVKVGDSDFLPSISVATIATTFVHLDLGVVGDVNDDCTYIETSAAGAGVSNFDLRLTPCLGKAAGTTITDSDTTEKGAAAGVTTQPALAACFADINTNGRYDTGDQVYLDTTAGAGMTASTGPAAFTLRLTAGGGKAAGTRVFASDSDFVSYNTAAACPVLTVVVGAPSVGWFDKDQSAGGAFTTGDYAYFTVLAAATPAPILVPINSIRISEANPSGVFGSQVKNTDTDFNPVISNAAGSIAPTWVHLDLGVVGDVNDDCDYLETSAGGGGVSNFDLRATACLGKAAGTLVTDSDTTEKGAAGAVTTNPALVACFADVNTNGRYDTGDQLYADTTAGAGMTASTGPAAFTLRLTAGGGKAAGTRVFASDSDFVSYNTAAACPALAAGPSLAWFDEDQSAGAAFTTGDDAYFMPVAVATGPNVAFPLNSIRVSEANPAGAYGSQMKTGEADFIAMTSILSIATAWVHLDLGVVGDVNDDCDYLETSAAGGGVSNFDLRVTSCLGKAAGSLVTDSDTTEKGAAAGVTTNPALATCFADVNTNGRYDSGDQLYADTTAGAGMTASTGPAAFTLRLTAGGGKAAGTRVFASDSDFVSYNTAAACPALAAGPSVSWFDADQSAGAAFTTGDSPYYMPAAVGTAAGTTFPLNSIRLGGPALTVGGPGPTGTTTPTGTGTTTPTGTGTTTPTGTGTTTPTGTTATTRTTATGGTTPTTTRTPGFELVAMVAGIAVAAVLVASRPKK